MDIDTIKYFDDKFEQVNNKIIDINNKINNSKLETSNRLTKLETDYKNQIDTVIHNAYRKWKIISIAITIGLASLGIIEGIHMM